MTTYFRCPYCFEMWPLPDRGCLFGLWSIIDRYFCWRCVRNHFPYLVHLVERHE